MDYISNQLAENNESYMNTLNATDFTILSTNDPMLDYLTNFDTTNTTEKLKNADPQEVLETLDLNRQLQTELDKFREEIEVAQQRNITLQTRLRQLKLEETVDSEKNNLISPGSQKTFGPPFFGDADGNTPPENEDEKNNQPLIFKSTRWTQHEKDALRRGVKDHNMKREALRALREKNTERTISLWCRRCGLGTIGETIYCVIQWTNHDHPCINNNEWTTQETKKLLEVAKQNEYRNWVKIALDLGTNRTAAECFKQYNRQSSNPRKWTKEEDEILTRAVDLYGEKNWQQVAHCLDNRTGQQCLHRWTKTLNPAIRRGRWKKEDDEALKNAVSIYGPGNWMKIQQYVLGRTDVQCRERWMNVLNEKLLSLVQNIGLGKWSKISTFMDGRTDNQCWRRYKILKKQAAKRNINRSLI
ncbi:234_t:CDS:10 [Diversispora eburnea]|uniref:234_t:CDS:1 n=1 Tax=Diversispora eburnea TaxID=1213867 RepID=A0A9N8WM72_9GLOM|nr:234_t:CDS:10 [Diversispora eburnea]